MSTVRGRIPTTDEVRNWATYVPDGTVGMHISARDVVAFDLWLAAIRAAILEEAAVIADTRDFGAFSERAAAHHWGARRAADAIRAAKDETP